MYDAGSAVFLLTGKVERAPFADYGRLTSGARAEKEHRMILSAYTNPVGFDNFKRHVLGVQSSARETAASVDKSWGTVSAATTRMTGAVGRDANLIIESYNRVAAAAARRAEAERAAADSTVRANERAAASAGGGGGIFSRGGGGGGGAGASSEAQAKKSSDAWKKGFDNIANIGKWVTLGVLGVGAVSVKMAADFQKQMTLVHTQAGYSQRDVDKLTKSLRDMAPAVGIGPAKLAEGLFHIASSGVPASKALGVLRIAAEGAKTGNADLEATTNALMAIMRSAPKDIHSVGEAMGVMNDIIGHGNLRMEELTGAMTTGLVPAGKAVGLGLRDVGAALDVLTSRGVPAQEGATRLRTVLGLIANPTNKAQKALDELGFSHDRLAQDFRSKGLVGALDDLQTSMGKVFGHKLDAEQERQALMAYGKQLELSGASANSITKALTLYKHQLDETGTGAIKASSLIASAFGGARMGTTMQILMQNIDDVRKHVEILGRPGAAQRFQQAWHDTQKDFSQRMAEMWAGVQRLAIIFGDFLIPKLMDAINWLQKVGKYFQEHKKLAEALATVIGGVLAAAVAAFFARFFIRIGEGLVQIGKFGAAIGRLPITVGESTTKVIDKLLGVNRELKAVEEQAGATGEALGGMGSGMAGAGGVAGGAGLGEGAILGLITGIHGPEAPGSALNPLAVVMMAGEAMGVSSAAGVGAKTAAEEQSLASGTGAAGSRAARIGGVSQGGILLPAGVRGVTPAEEAALVSGEAPAVAAGAGRLAGVRGALSTGAGALTRGAGIAGMGVLGAQLVGSTVGGRTGSTIATIGTGASIGAGVGSLAGPIGTAVGAALGGVGAIVAKALIGDTRSFGQKVVDNLTKGFAPATGRDATDTRAQAAKLLDQAAALNHPAAVVAGQTNARGGRITVPGLETEAQKAKAQAEQFQAGQDIAKALEKGWSQYKFQSEPVMFGQLKSEIKGLPPAAQAGGIDSALQFAKGLEKQGKLVPGSVRTMLDSIKREFPGFTKYLGLEGEYSTRTFFKALDFKRTEQNARKQLNNIANDFPQVVDAIKSAGGGVEDRAAAMVKSLKGIAANGTAPMRKQAEADLNHLKGVVTSTLNSEADVVKSQGNDMKQHLSDSTQAARDVVEKHFNQMVDKVDQAMRDGTTTVADGAKLINDLLTQELSDLGVKVPRNVHLSNASLRGLVNLAQHGASHTSSGGIGHRAGGGMLPGAEHGLGDVMTLIDPTGAPRAKLAGDEAIFNRHQMPYVEAGLQMLGFHGAQDLWNTVDTPHNYAGGGRLKGAGSPRGVTTTAGGGSGYLFPFPPGTVIGRTDEGIDANMPVGSPIGPIGRARIGDTIPGWYAGQPLLKWQLLDGPRAGMWVYVAEQISNLAPKGKIVQANEAVARYASSGTGIEYGWSAPGVDTLAHATTGYTEGQVTPAGTDMRNFILGLSHGKIVGGSLSGVGAGLGSPQWKDIKGPKVRGTGAIKDMVQGALDRMTSAANQFGQSQMGSAVSPGGSVKGIKAMPGGWFRVGATLDPTMGQPAAGSGPHGGMSFAELLVAGNNAGLRGQDLAATLGEQNGQYGLPEGATILVRQVGSDTAYRIWKNDVGSGQAGDPFYKVDLHQKIADLLHFSGKGPIEVHRARGGWLGNFARGGSPWGPLPSGVGHIPGYRPPRTRRSRHGFHVVGGAGSGAAGKTSKPTKSKGSAKSKTQARPRQTLTQSTATLLDSLGLGSFVADQNELGTLDTLYTSQENLYTTFDTGTASGTLPKTDLNVLMGIREKEWDILDKEYIQLPGAIAKLQARQDREQGTPKLHPAGGNPRPPHGRQSRPDAFYEQPVMSSSSGVDKTQHQIDQISTEITNLEKELKLAARTEAKVRHVATGHVMDLADQNAGILANVVDNQNAVHQQRYRISQQRNRLHGQLNQITSKKTSPTTLAGIVDKVLGGGGSSLGGSSTSNADKEAKKKIHAQLNALQGQDTALGNAAYQIGLQLKDARAHQAALARRYRRQGFDEAWAYQLKRWKVEDKIAALKVTLAKLKASLKQEQATLSATSKALTTLEGWESGGLQGTSSIAESLQGIAFDMLSLYQQGADLPTPGRKGPTIKSIEKLLTSMGLQIPAGLSQGSAAAAAEQSAAYADFQAFQASRAQLYSQFGSNFVGASAQAFPGSAGVGAGTQFFGAASGPSAMAKGGLLGVVMPASPKRNDPGSGGTTFNIHNHFGAGPPDPHHWSAGVAHEFGAMV